MGHHHNNADRLLSLSARLADALEKIVDQHPELDRVETRDLIAEADKVLNASMGVQAEGDA